MAPRHWLTSSCSRRSWRCGGRTECCPRRVLTPACVSTSLPQDVRFSSCRGTEDGGLALVESLAATTKLRKLELSDNMFSPEIGVALAKVLAQQKGLVHLDVSDISAFPLPCAMYTR